MENKANEGSAQAGEGQENQTENVSVSDLMKKVEALEASNKRLLEESKGYKEKYRKTAEEVSETEKKIALEKGDLQKLLELTRNELNEKKSEIESMREKVIGQEIQKTVSQFASDAINLEDVLAQSAYVPILKEAVDKEALAVSPEKAKQFVDEVRKAKPYLFKSASQPGVVTKKPNGQAASFPKSLHEMTSQQIEEMIRSGNFRN